MLFTFVLISCRFSPSSDNLHTCMWAERSHHQMIRCQWMSWNQMDSFTGAHGAKRHRINRRTASESDYTPSCDYTIDFDRSHKSSGTCIKSQQIWSCCQELVSPFDPNNNVSLRSLKQTVPTKHGPKTYPLICLSPQDRKFLCKNYPNINRGHRLSLGGGFLRSPHNMPHHAALRRAESSADSAIML